MLRETNLQILHMRVHNRKNTTGWIRSIGLFARTGMLAMTSYGILGLQCMFSLCLRIFVARNESHCQLCDIHLVLFVFKAPHIQRLMLTMCTFYVLPRP